MLRACQQTLEGIHSCPCHCIFWKFDHNYLSLVPKLQLTFKGLDLISKLQSLLLYGFI
jgi:hypothetical protein